MNRRIIRLEHAVGFRGAENRSIDEYRRLACAVLLQAHRDAANGDARGRHFLRGGPSLEFWCHLGGIDASAVIERATVAIEQAEARRRGAAA